MIEKILSEIEKLIKNNEEGANACYPSAMARESAYYECKAIVQEVAKEYGNGWTLCSDRLPEESKLVLIYAESTARGGSIRCVAELRNGFWFAQITSDTLGLTGIGQYNVIKWAELPEV